MTSRADERTSSADAAGPDVRALRTDIQALRALAVMAVVFFHLWPQSISGGFIGVDVFFVISGYLITGHLLRQVQATGRVDLGRFWAGRVRRLLPASLLVLMVTAVTVLLAVPRSLKEQFLSEVLASAVYVQNWRLAHDSVDYLAADNRPSPTQHFWSLSVEEQFYVGLPLLVLVTVAVAGLVRVQRVRAVFVVLLLVTVGSFAYNVHLTDADPGVAYFSTFTRMWEFGLGGLVSFAAPAVSGLSRRRAGVHTALTAAGAAAVVVALFVIDSETPFPGVAAVVPVVGAAAVVRWGGGTFASWVGALPPVAMLGRISYALYLWHWPLIVIPPLVTFHALTTSEKLLVLGASIAIAWASTRFFEEPIRFRLRPRVRPLAVLAVALVAMTPVVVVSGVASAVIREDGDTRVAELPLKVESSQPCLGAAALDPAAPGCDHDPAKLDGVIVNDPSRVADDTPKRPGCWAPHGVETVNVCTIGPQTGSALHLFAVGDSHNLALVSAYEKIAEQYNWRIDVAAHPGCYWTTAALKRASKAQMASCEGWQANLDEYLAASDFDAIIATHASNGIVRAPRGKTRDEALVDGLVDAWRTQTSKGVPVIAIVDNPGTDETNVQCVEKFGTTDPDRCATPRSEGLGRFDGNAEAVARLAGTSLVDMTDFYCTPTVCPSVIGGVAVFRDTTHVTSTYLRTVAPYLGARLLDALRAQHVI